MKKLIVVLSIAILTMGIFAGCEKQEDVASTQEPVATQEVKSTDAPMQTQAAPKQTEIAEPQTSDTPSTITLGTLSQQQQEKLEEYAFYLTEMTTDTIDSEFLKNFIFMRYTCVDYDAYPRENKNDEWDYAVIPVDEVKAEIKLVFGIDAGDDILPQGEKGSAIYLEDGKYYVGASDYPDYTMKFEHQDGNKAIVNVFLADEQVPELVIEYTLEASNNANGFIIIGYRTSVVNIYN